MDEDTVSLTTLVDGHVDLPYYMMNHAANFLLSDLDHGPFTIQQAKRVGIRLFCTALYCEDRFNGDPAFDHFQAVLNFTLEHFDQVHIVKKGDSLNGRLKDPDQMATLLLLENADALVDHLSYVKKLGEMGIHVVGLTHAGKNRIGDGNAVTYPQGLTKAGGQVIRALDESGVLIDVAHLHPTCFWQLLDLVKNPIISSHTGVRNIYDIPRNIHMDQAKEVMERGGVIGISFNPEMLGQGRRSSIDHVFAHMDALVQRLGPECVAIGSDFCGYEHYAQGIENISQILKLAEMLLAHGYGEEGVHQIMGRNWLHLFEKRHILVC